MATPAPSFMIPTGKLRPNSEPIVLPVTKAKVTALLPKEGKEEAKARKVRDQVQTDQVAAKAAAVQEDQKVRVDLKEKEEKESVESHALVADFHTTTRLQPRVEEPLPLARQRCLCASTTLMGLATKVKTATFIIQRFASTTRRENATRALFVQTTTSIPMQRNEPQIQRRRSLRTKPTSVWLKS